MAEWFKVLVLKTKVLKIPWVQIPLYPKVFSLMVKRTAHNGTNVGSNPAKPINL